MRNRFVSCLAVLAGLVVFCAVRGLAAGDESRKARGGSSPAESAGAEGGDLDQFEGEYGRGRGTESKKVFDPLSGYNRVMFHFNDKFYLWVAKPLATGYGYIIPTPGRVAISRGYNNMAFPVRFVSLGLQGRFSRVGSELGRFLVNSTLGIGGLFDPAEAWFGIKPVKADLGQTFGKWGIGDGFPLTLPFFGPSNLRDALGMAPNTFLSPVTYMQYGGVISWKENVEITVGGHFNEISLHLGEYEKLKKDALDPYTFIRDAYKQNRDQRIKE